MHCRKQRAHVIQINREISARLTAKLLRGTTAKLLRGTKVADIPVEQPTKG